MNWLDIVRRSETVRAIFGDHVPSLRNVSVHEIGFNRDGRTMFLRFDLEEFPEAAPAKWKTDGYNTVQVRLSLDETSSVRVEGWAHEIVGDLTLAVAGDEVGLQLTSAQCKLSATCAFIHVDKISGYVDAARVPNG